MTEADALRMQTMELLDRLFAWGTEAKRKPLTAELTLHQAGVLHLCILMGDLGMVELARMLGSAPSTVTAMVDRLVRKGLIERVPDPEDGRRVRARVTPAGRDHHHEIEARSLDYTRRLFADWPQADVQTFHGLLARFLEDTDGVAFLVPEQGERT